MEFTQELFERLGTVAIVVVGMVYIIRWLVAKVEQKEKENSEMQEKLMTAFTAHTKTNTELREEIKASRTLTEKMYEVMLTNGGKS